MGKNDPNLKAKQKREHRLVLVADLHKRGYSFRVIRERVLEEFPAIITYSLATVKKDVDFLLTEARKARLEDTQIAIQLELERIDMQLVELWEAWDKSKKDNKLTSKKQSGTAAKATPVKVVDSKGALKDEVDDANTGIKTTSIEQTIKDNINYGDPRYQDLIYKLGIERRKILGHYAAEKKEITGKDGSPIFNGFDAFMAQCEELANNDNDN
ncbi:hypothetical protein [Pedobacter sp. B4-66]|uniref:hypothetical protein n=1 Tax=Pedobacter sp. B4-66 TaxID=2817280 RepID=UPI001BDB632F|nr:hypothetical protein [Pedobacter sp. B4-66]